MANKDAVIRQVYYDADTGFGSISNTYKEAKRVLNTITYVDVKDFLERQASKQVKKGHRSFYSYVAKEKLEEIQIDLADFTISAEHNDGFRYAFVAVDIFTKKAHAVPIKNKERDECIRAMKEVIQVIGVPKQLFHDQEGAWQTPGWNALMYEHRIKDMNSSTHAPFAERMVQTIKNMIHDQMRGLTIASEKWVEVLPKVLKKYNNTKHSTTGVTPNEATRDDHKIDVYFNIKQKAQFNRKYPPINVGDEVRKYIKPDMTKKGYRPSWSGETFKVIMIDREGDRYAIDDFKLGTGGRAVRVRGTRSRMYGRNELLLVRGKETKDTV
jgi:hypothetical protein